MELALKKEMYMYVLRSKNTFHVHQRWEIYFIIGPHTQKKLEQKIRTLFGTHHAQHRMFVPMHEISVFADYITKMLHFVCCASFLFILHWLSSTSV